ncbi:MAG: TonB family protein [Myxococcota bacterium]|nr:TonB family protein [Myxococcota bacterium]
MLPLLLLNLLAADADDQAPAQEEGSYKELHFQAITQRRIRRPRYPEAAREAGIEGRCSVRVWVDARGKVTETQIVECPEVFVPEVLRAASTSTYFPLKVDGEKVPFTFVQSFEFHLDGPQPREQEAAPREPSFDWARAQGRCGACVVKKKVGPDGRVEATELGDCDLGMAGPAFEALEGFKTLGTGEAETYKLRFEHTQDCSAEGDQPNLVWAYAEPTHTPDSVNKALGEPTAWVAPTYPQGQEEEAVCTARIRVHPQGHVDHVQVWGCTEPFGEATRGALERWVYTSFERNGLPMWRSLQRDLHFDPAQPSAQVTQVGMEP